MPYKIWVDLAPITIRQTYTKTGTTPPVAPYLLTSGSTNITNYSGTNTDIDYVPGPCPLTASVLIATQTGTPKTVTISLIVKNITDGITLSTQGPAGFITLGTGYTYRWTGDATKIYEVTASASNT
jgi:hypothetical protein